MEDHLKSLKISRSTEDPTVLIAICRQCGQIVGVNAREEYFESTAREHSCPALNKPVYLQHHFDFDDDELDT